MKTTLLIMAAGIGSRFGTGIKQLEPVDDAGHIIMDYSIAIGGVEREDKSIEESHEIVKCKPADNLEIASWNSFVRKLDEYHGHHPVQ